MTELKKQDDIQGVPIHRIEALIDGVFAFAMTLLILGISVPDSSTISAADLGGYLVKNIHNFASFILSFVLLAWCWSLHHRQSRWIRTSDSWHVWINIVMLLFVATMPFSSALVSNYEETSIAEFFFAANFMALGLTIFFNWVYATHDHHLVSPEMDEATIALGLRRGLVIPSVSAAVILLSFFSPRWSSSVYLLIPIILRTPWFRIRVHI